jgi:hypothetical protein
MKQHKPWFNEECLKLLNQRKQAKMQWLQNHSQTSRNNMNDVRGEISETKIGNI